MADKELRKLKRRDLLHMLLTQCQETERLQLENGEMSAELTELRETLERLKGKLNVKDERLNEKDARIAELTAEIEDMRTSKAIELAEAGNIAEASLRINGIFEAAQRAAEQYLMNVRRLAGREDQNIRRISGRVEEQPAIEAAVQPAIAMKPAEKKQPAETGWRPGIIRKKPVPVKARREAQSVFYQAETDAGGNVTQIRQRYAASGDMHG